MIFGDPRFSGACKDAVLWVGDRTPRQAWDDCPRGDWLLWAAGRAGVELHLLVLAEGDCAETALQYTDDPRPLAAIKAARAWAEDPSEKNRLAAEAAAAAAWAAAVALMVAYSSAGERGRLG